MNFVKMEHIRSGFYGIISYKCEKLYYLAAFLNSEMSGPFSYNFFVHWLEGKYNQDYAYGNAWGLMEKNGKIYVCFQHDSEEEIFNYLIAQKKKY